MYTCLVAGGAGFIGSHLCRKLLSSGHTVWCVDNFVSGTKDAIIDLLDHDRFRLIEYNVSHPLEGAGFPEGPIDAVFHLASPASPNKHSAISYFAHPMETMDANTIGTKHLATLAKQHHARFLFASTSEAYGDPLVHPQSEDYRGNVSTTGPRSVYDESKRFGETLTAHFVRLGLDGRIIRIFNTYGPGMRLDDMRMLIDFIRRALSNEPIHIFGDGMQTRSLCYIDDMVEGIIRAMWTEKTSGEVINIGSEDEHTVNEYATLVKQYTGSDSEIVHSEPLPIDDPLRRRADITKARTLLGWEPGVSLEEGIRRTIAYVQSQLAKEHNS
jgi:dTDP-glucose 4,6-dehydratase/UDP-glucuronate decarboxylase